MRDGDALRYVLDEYQHDISNLSDENSEQQGKIGKLETLNTRLRNEIRNCPEAAETATEVNREIKEVFEANKALQIKTDSIRRIKVIRSPLRQLR